MPGLNRKGPEGQGPGTGRRMGTCRPHKDESSDSLLTNDLEEPGIENFTSRDFGRGWGFGRGRGKGRGGRFRGGGGYGRGRSRGPASE